MLIEFPESVGYEDETHGYPRRAGRCRRRIAGLSARATVKN
jgi:hypothetical protein